MSAARAERAAWLRLGLIPGIGPATQRALLTAFGLPEAVFASGRAAIAATVGESAAALLLDTDNQAEIEKALDWAETPGNHLLTLADAAYPQSLLQAGDPPLILYAKGRIELLQSPSLAMVGSRNATAQGVENARAFAANLSQAGMTVVSGLALGIDAAAHRGGLEGPAGTIAFIGTGADRIYPVRNAELARRIAVEGLIVSEFALGTPPLSHNFPRRNRLIAAITRGTLVVEAALASGSLITARLAGELGREVFAIPGSIHSPLSKGCHQLIRQGAKLVESAQDILEELSWGGSAVSDRVAPAPAGAVHQAPAVEPEAERLLSLMGFDPIDIDSLCTRSNLTPEVLFAMLLTLELDGRVEKLPGNRFQQLPPSVA
ncbi:DNA-processing protein DprA [Niveibacterium sp. SC-1]|uniref:DNA-processing protein DprA n=1 Tax=Niveibacterium sp. SC-1 TaxID=3135646 RepID=UPI00311E8E21